VVNGEAAAAGWWWIVPVVLVVLTAAGLRIYLPAAREVLVCGEGRVGTWWVGRLDGLVALVLVVWFLMLGRDALAGGEERVVEFRHVVSGAAIYGAILLFLTGLLLYRDFRPAVVFGFGDLTFRRSLGRALLYLAAAYPLLILVQAMVYGAAGGNLSPQEVVEFLQRAEGPRDRLAVVAMAVIVAPVAEEVIFRGYLYPVVKKYAGTTVALLLTSVLFAVLHGHVPSIPALTMLAVCLGLAYEKSGSLLVPMIMHAVFNAVSVAGILFLT
jgi:membrane protease YdiL (CAAX protease family)